MKQDLFPFKQVATDAPPQGFVNAGVGDMTLYTSMVKQYKFVLIFSYHVYHGSYASNISGCKMLLW